MTWHVLVNFAFGPMIASVFVALVFNGSVRFEFFTSAAAWVTAFLVSSFAWSEQIVEVAIAWSGDVDGGSKCSSRIRTRSIILSRSSMSDTWMMLLFRADIAYLVTNVPQSLSVPAVQGVHQTITNMLCDD